MLEAARRHDLHRSALQRGLWQLAKDKLRGKHRPILNDNLGGGFETFLLDACVNILAVTKGAVYICMSIVGAAHAAAGFRGGRRQMVDVRHLGQAHFTLGRADYQRQYEPILYGWPAGHDRYWCGARDQGDVWFSTSLPGTTCIRR